MARGWTAAWGLMACTAGTPDEVGPAREALAVLPTASWIVDGAVQVPDAVPAGTTPVPQARMALRTGLSPVQTTVFRTPFAIDPASLPGLRSGGDGVVLWDLTEDAAVPAFAELDAWPRDDGGPAPLLVRPLRPIPAGHEVAVAVRQTVTGVDGSPWPVADWLEAVLDGRPHPTLVGEADGLREAAEALGRAGYDDVAVLTRFPVDDPTGPLRHALAETGTPSAWAWSTVEDVDEGASLPDGIARRLRGTFTTTRWRGDEGTLVFGADGVPQPQGTWEAELYAYVSASARDGVPGEAPVLVFGHGIFANPDLYLDEDDDPSSVVALANDLGAVVVGTTWRGLTTSDLGIPLAVSRDFWRLPELTDALFEGVAATSALIDLVGDGALLDDPELGGLGDPDTVRYHGISLGGIEGAVLMAARDAAPPAVLHVGGSTWSTMLERSTHWTLFEPSVVETVPSPDDRQLLYATSQLLWDPVDPAAYASGLADRDVLWQIARGDDQVPNLTTWSLARGSGATVLLPASGAPADLAAADAPVRGPAIATFDPELGNSEEDNRPAVDTTAHEDPRNWTSARAQAVRFLDPVDPGVVEAVCGDDPCTPATGGAP